MVDAVGEVVGPGEVLRHLVANGLALLGCLLSDSDSDGRGAEGADPALEVLRIVGSRKATLLEHLDNLLVNGLHLHLREVLVPPEEGLVRPGANAKVEALPDL